MSENLNWYSSLSIKQPQYSILIYKQKALLFFFFFFFVAFLYMCLQCLFPISHGVKQTDNIYMGTKTKLKQNMHGH